VIYIYDRHPVTKTVTPLHYISPSYTPLHYISPSYTPLHYISPSYTPLHYISPSYTQLHSTSPNYTSLHFTQLHSTSLHFTQLHSTSLLFTQLHSTSLHILFLYFHNESQQDALFLKFILMKNTTCFGQIYCPSSGVLILYSQQFGICHTGYVDCLLARSGWTVSLSKTFRVLYQNNVEKQCMLLAFIIRIYHDSRSSECQIHYICLFKISIIWDVTSCDVVDVYRRRKLETVCSHTQLCQLRCFNDCTRQLHVSAFTGHLQVVFKRT